MKVAPITMGLAGTWKDSGFRFEEGKEPLQGCELRSAMI